MEFTKALTPRCPERGRKTISPAVKLIASGVTKSRLASQPDQWIAIGIYNHECQEIDGPKFSSHL